MLSTIHLTTNVREGLINITPQIKELITNSGISEGICVIYVPHTTAAVTVNSGMDPLTIEDIYSEVRRLVPTRVDFKHIYDTPADAAGHIKTTLVGNSLTFIISGNNLLLGSSQSILFYEFDGPRERQLLVRVIEDK